MKDLKRSFADKTFEIESASFLQKQLKENNDHSNKCICRSFLPPSFPIYRGRLKKYCKCSDKSDSLFID